METPKRVTSNMQPPGMESGPLDALKPCSIGATTMTFLYWSTGNVGVVLHVPLYVRHVLLEALFNLKMYRALA